MQPAEVSLPGHRMDLGSKWRTASPHPRYLGRWVPWCPFYSWASRGPEAQGDGVICSGAMLGSPVPGGFPRTRTGESSAPCGLILGIIVSSASQRVEGLLRSPCLPCTRLQARSRGPENERSLLRVTPVSSSSSTLRTGLRSPRSQACETSPCWLPGAMPTRTSFLLQGLAGGLLQLDTRVDLFRGMGFPSAWLLEARTLGGCPERLLACFHGSVCVSPEPRPRPPPPDRLAAPAPLPLSSGPSQRPCCLQRGVEKSHPGLVNHPRVTRSGFRPWKEMAAFFHCMEEKRQGLDQARGAGGAQAP